MHKFMETKCIGPEIVLKWKKKHGKNNNLQNYAACVQKKVNLEQLLIFRPSSDMVKIKKAFKSYKNFLFYDIRLHYLYLLLKHQK